MSCLLFKLGQDVCKHSSVFNVLLNRPTLLKQTENVVLLRNIQALAQLLDNLSKEETLANHEPIKFLVDKSSEIDSVPLQPWWQS